MLVFNLLNRLFGPKETITRDEIDRYVNDVNSGQATEEKAAADGFDDTALAGFRETNLTTEAMKNLDDRILRKYGNSNNNFTKAAILIVVLIGASGLLLLWNSSENESTVPRVSEFQQIEENIDERSDIEMSEEIQLMEEIELTKQVKPEQLADQFSKHQHATMEAVAQTDQKSDDAQPKAVDVTSLPINNNNTIESDQATALCYKSVSEVYLHDLKLVDYRKYRSGTVKTERMHYSGTPANVGDGTKETTDEIIWKAVDIPYHEYLEKSMALFAKRKYKQALQRYEIILKSFPNDVNANFYSALCLFNLGQYNKTLERLKASYTIEFGNFYEEALWFKGLTYERMKNKNEAQRIFQQIVNEGGYYKDEALKKL